MKVDASLLSPRSRQPDDGWSSQTAELSYPDCQKWNPCSLLSDCYPRMMPHAECASSPTQQVVSDCLDR
ncbi:hypothetical protein Mapa_015868 [Marchantia paleacea]|nr:hypothetical protein Mapa_015868 [Marchantia paleacea]